MGALRGAMSGPLSLLMALLLVQGCQSRSNPGTATQTREVLATVPDWSIGLGRISGLTSSPDGKWLVLSTLARDYVRDATSFELVSTLGDLHCVAFVPDSESLLANDAAGNLVEVGLRSGTVKRTIREASDAQVRSVSFGPDGTQLALLEQLVDQKRADQTITSGTDGGLRIKQGGTVTVVTKSRVLILGWPDCEVLTQHGVSNELDAYVIAWSPDSRRLFIAGQGPHYELLDLDGGPRKLATGKVPYVHGFYDAKTDDGYSYVTQAAFLDEDRVLAVGESGLGMHGPWPEIFTFDISSAERLWPRASDEHSRQEHLDCG